MKRLLMKKCAPLSCKSVAILYNSSINTYASLPNLKPDLYIVVSDEDVGNQALRFN